MTDKIDAALALARRGFCVFPLAINGKTPAMDGNWQKLATKDPARIGQLWRCPVFDSPIDYNIGIAIGPDTVVVDVDVRDGKPGAKSLALWEAINDPLPETYEVTTASGGRHLYFKSERSGSFPARLAEGIDLKDHGDYVVGPGSEIDGLEYRSGLHGLAVDVERAPAHLDAIGATVTRGARPLPREDRAATLVDPDTESAINRAIDYLVNSAPQAIEGAGGDLATLTVANHVGDRGISQAQCVELMLDHWNETKAIPPWDADELADKVANAYRYRQNAVGAASPEADFDDVEAEVKAREAAREAALKATGKPTPKRGLYFIPWELAAPDLDRPYLIDDVIDAGAMVVTYGDSNVGKTYVVLDQAFHVAAGKDWNGHKVRGGLVVYVAAEGGGGFARRIEAFKRHYKAERVPFALVPCPIDLQSEQSDTGKLVKVIREAEAHYGAPCVLVVIDTLARAMGGGDENAAVDMGKFVVHCDRLRAVIGATVNVIHHTGKDKAKGARGSSALRAATDTEIEVDTGKLSVNKQRDMAALKPLRFELSTVQVGTRADGKEVSACVVQWIEESEFEVRTSPLADAFREELVKLLDAKRAELEEQGKADKAVISVPWGDWKMSGFDSLKTSESKAVSESYLFKLRTELLTAGVVKQTKQKQWVTCETH